MMNKKLFCIFLFSLLTTNLAMARSNVYKVNLIFINCTPEEIRVENRDKPYKFSLNPEKPAKNGYSEDYPITIPPQSVLNYPDMSVYFNNYYDGKMNLSFSGGVNGEAELKQKEDTYDVFDWTQLDTVSYYYIDKITSSVKMNTRDIEFLNPTQIIQTYYLWGTVTSYANQNNLVINLGCTHAN